MITDPSAILVICNSLREYIVFFSLKEVHFYPRSLQVSRSLRIAWVYAGVRKELREQRAREVLVSVGLGNRLNHKPSQLSGGQQQRVAIARALINHPALLLADEPTGNLDSKTGAEIMAMLQMLHQRGLTIVIVTHDHSVAAYAQRQIELQDGVVVRDELNRLYDPHHSSGSEAAYNGPYNELQQDKGEA